MVAIPPVMAANTPIDGYNTHFKWLQHPHKIFNKPQTLKTKKKRKQLQLQEGYYINLVISFPKLFGEVLSAKNEWLSSKNSRTYPNTSLNPKKCAN